MTRPRLLAPTQQLLALALSALLTSAVLLSLGAQADTELADARFASQADQRQQQLCALPALTGRS